MKKILSLGLFALVITVAALTVAPLTLAQSVTPTQAQCETAKERLATQLTKVNAVKTTQTNVYTDIQTQFGDIVTTAGQTEFDTASLLEAQVALAETLTAYTTAATDYSTALTKAKDVTCGSSNTELTNAVTAAQTSLATLRTATTEVRTAIREDVKISLKEYATWLKDNAMTLEEK